MLKVEMIAVEHGVHCHEARDIVVAVFLVEHEKFILSPVSFHNKVIFSEKLPFPLAEEIRGEAFHIGKVRGRKDLRHGGLYALLLFLFFPDSREKARAEEKLLHSASSLFLSLFFLRKELLRLLYKLLRLRKVLQL